MFYTKEGTVPQENVVAVDSSVTGRGNSMCACALKRIREQCFTVTSCVICQHSSVICIRFENEMPNT
jgi:hypothetical protein